MFNNLRKKFVMLNMCIISIVLLISFSIIYIINRVNTYEEMYSKLEINNGNTVPNNIDTVHTTNIPINLGNMNNDITSFNLLINSDDSIEQILSYYDYDESYYEDIFNLTNDNEFIKLDDEIWIYSKIKISNNLTVVTDAEYIISYVNVTDEINSLNYLFMGLIIIFLIMMVLVYYISIYFSNKYTIPIEENYLKQKRFIADASHELKTPIAIIRANADALLMSKKDTIQNQEKWINYIKDETVSMTKLITDLLTLAKSEEVKLNIQKSNASDLLGNSIIHFEAFAFEKNIKIKKSIEQNIILNTDSDKLKQLFVIFLDNAIKYSEEKSTIDIKLYKEKKEVYFIISNKGTIQAEKINKIFDRFYKCDEARTNTKSFGLGLSIANNIINDLNYHIKATSENNKVKFTIKMK